MEAQKPPFEPSPEQTLREPATTSAPRVRASATLADEVPPNQRPREKLLAAGTAARLADAELLAILLGSGTKGHNVMAVAQALILQYKTLAFLAKASLKDLRKVKGIGDVKAIQITAMLELARRALATAHDDDEAALLSNPAAVAREVWSHSAGIPKESFFVMPLDKKHRKCGPLTMITQGTLDSSLAHPREVFSLAVRWDAASIIVAHNHPSGDPAPSRDDEKVTTALFAAGRILGIPLTDHVIVGDPATRHPGWLSLRELRPDLFAAQ